MITQLTFRDSRESIVRCGWPFWYGICFSCGWSANKIEKSVKILHAQKVKRWDTCWKQSEAGLQSHWNLYKQTPLKVYNIVKLCSRSTFECCGLYWSMRLVTQSKFTGMLHKLKEAKISNKHDRLKIKIPASGRQISWLFTSMTGEVN